MVVVEFGFYTEFRVFDIAVIRVEYVFEGVRSGRVVGRVGRLRADAVLASVADHSNERLVAWYGLKQ